MIQFQRKRDWRAALATLIEERRRVPFSDANNCALFLADCIEAISGVDLAKAYRGRFTTIEEGVALLKAAGFDGLPGFLAEHFAEVHPAMAQAGDIMLFPSEIAEWAGGIVNGERVTVLTPQGLGTVSRMAAVRAFRVP